MPNSTEVLVETFPGYTTRTPDIAQPWLSLLLERVQTPPTRPVAEVAIQALSAASSGKQRLASHLAAEALKTLRADDGLAPSLRTLTRSNIGRVVDPPNTWPLIFVEGPPGSGKTTYAAKSAHQLGVHHIPESALFLDESFIDVPMDGATIGHSVITTAAFLATEVMRSAIPEGYFDTSWLSHLAYAYAYERLAGQLGYYQVVLGFARELARLELVNVPAAVHYMDCDHQIALNRLKCRSEDPMAPTRGTVWEDLKFRSDHALWFSQVRQAGHIPVIGITLQPSDEI